LENKAEHIRAEMGESKKWSGWQRTPDKKRDKKELALKKSKKENRCKKLDPWESYVKWAKAISGDQGQGGNHSAQNGRSEEMRVETRKNGTGGIGNSMLEESEGSMQTLIGVAERGTNLEREE